MADKPTPPAGNGLVTADTASGTVESMRAYQRMIREMAGMATMDEGEGRQLGDEMDAILSADSLDDMWEADELGQFNAKKLSGCELDILSFVVKFAKERADDEEEINSPYVDPDSGKQMYLLIRSARLNDSGKFKKEIRLPEVGEEFTWNTSAPRIVTKIWWLLKHGYFDNHATVEARIEGTALGKGRSVEKLKPLIPVTVTERGPKRGRTTQTVHAPEAQTSETPF
jgi:hypothetical protein